MINHASLDAAVLLCACTQALRPPTLLAPRQRSQALRAKTDENYDAVVVGAGVGGLCTAALLARYDRRVLLVEAHDVVGGCAHSFDRGGYTCDSGPSLWAGCAQPSTSPLRQVFDAIGRDVDWVQYDGWGLHDLKADKRWRMTVGPDAFADVMQELGGSDGERAWRALLKGSEPVVDAAMACPPMALRADPLGFVQTALVPYLLPAIFRASVKAKAFIPDLLTGASSQLFDLADDAHNDFLERWIDYLAFALSGLPADGTVGAAVAYTLGDLHRPNAVLDYPVGGSGAVCEALADYISDKAGCAVRTRCRVDEILVDADGSVTGVRLASGDEVLCPTVVSNADAWTTATKLLKPSPLPRRELASVAEEARADAVVRSSCGLGLTPLVYPPIWIAITRSSTRACSRTTARPSTRRGTCTSFPSRRSSTPGSRRQESIWPMFTRPRRNRTTRGLSSTGRAPSTKKKLEAAEPFWRALEAVVPDVRQRAEMTTIGTPLTHARFNNRHMGTYGPAGATVEGDLKGFGDGGTPVKGFWQVGDSQFPGIGLPAAAASGILVANALVSVAEHRALLDDMRRRDALRGQGLVGERMRRRGRRAGRIAVDASLGEVGCSV